MEGSKIWGIDVLKTDSVLPREKFVCPDRTLFWAEIFCAYSSIIYLTFVRSAFVDLSNRRFSKKLIFTDCSVLTDFCYYLHLPLQCLSVWVLLIKELFLKMCYSIWCYNRCFINVITEPKGIYYFDCTNAANKNCVEFYMKEVFKCRERRMM